MKRMSVGGQAGIKKYNFFPAVDFKEDQKGALSWGWLGDLFWKRTDSGTVDWLAHVGYCHSVLPSPPKFQTYFGRWSHLDQLFSTFLKSQNMWYGDIPQQRPTQFLAPKSAAQHLIPADLWRTCNWRENWNVFVAFVKIQRVVALNGILSGPR